MTRFFQYLHDNWVGVVLTMTLILFVVYLYAFFQNGLHGAHFDLGSCWTGIGAIATAAATGWGKWVVDSRFNSLVGQLPEQKQ